MKSRARSSGFQPGLLLLFLTAVLAASCRTAPPLPPADFSAPGWHVQQGQAVWKPSSSRPELAGELLLATNANGNFLVQFSKMPFPLATAQTSGKQWQIEFGTDKFSRRGRGTPPDRFAWFQLPRALRDASAGNRWKLAHPDAASWHLENPRTGETLEVEFFP
jgi:hypothetical protein